MSHTLVVNLHYEDYDVLITRKNPRFGNQHPINRIDNRATVITKHWGDMKRKLRAEAGYHEAVMGLEGKRLGCVCKPMECHGDLYVDYIKAVRHVEAEQSGIGQSDLINAAIAKVDAARESNK